MKKGFETRRSCGPLAAFLLLGAASANAAVIVNFGNVNTPDPQLSDSASSTGIGLSDAFVTGTLATTNPTSVTFDLAIGGTNGSPQWQNQAVGISGGIAASGIDNNNATGPQETMSFTIGNFSGLDAGQSLVITEIAVLFATSAESYTLNGGPSTSFVNDSTGGNPADVFTVNGTTVSIGAGATGDTRFAIDSISVDVIPEPESSAVLLGGIGILALLPRRRRIAADFSF